MASNQAKPRILILSLNHQDWFDDMYKSLLAKLDSKATIQPAKTAGPALRKLSEQPPPLAVLVSDEALATEEYTHVWDAVLQYVREGGTARHHGPLSSLRQAPCNEALLRKGRIAV